MGCTKDEFVKKARNVHGLKYDYAFVEYVNAKTKVKIICPVHGVFEQTPDKHVNGSCGCPDCAGNKSLDSDGFIWKAMSIHGDKYGYERVDYQGNRVPVTIMCPIHGPFSQLPYNHLQGRGCAKCADNVKLSKDEFIERARAVHGDKYGYKHVEYHGNRTVVTITCSVHGPFRQVAGSHLAGCGCPACSYEERVAERDSQAIYEKSVKTCLERYGVGNPMLIPGMKERHQSIVASRKVRERSDRTKLLHGTFNTSKPEDVLYDMLVGTFGSDDVSRHYRSSAYPFRCDYYVRSRDLYIELNAHWSHGGHWYGPDDVSVVDAWRSKGRFYANAADTFSVRDVRKREVARVAGLNYVVFWRSDLSDAVGWFDAGCPDRTDWA